MSQEHERMVEALKKIVVTRLRDHGFRGSFPHFHRPSEMFMKRQQEMFYHSLRRPRNGGKDNILS